MGEKPASCSYKLCSYKKKRVFSKVLTIKRRFLARLPDKHAIKPLITQLMSEYLQTYFSCFYASFIRTQNNSLARKTRARVASKGERQRVARVRAYSGKKNDNART